MKFLVYKYGGISVYVYRSVYFTRSKNLLYLYTECSILSSKFLRVKEVDELKLVECDDYGMLDINFYIDFMCYWENIENLMSMKGSELCVMDFPRGDFYKKTKIYGTELEHDGYVIYIRFPKNNLSVAINLLDLKLWITGSDNLVSISVNGEIIDEIIPENISKHLKIYNIILLSYSVDISASSNQVIYYRDAYTYGDEALDKIIV